MLNFREWNQQGLNFIWITCKFSIRKITIENTSVLNEVYPRRSLPSIGSITDENPKKTSNVFSILLHPPLWTWTINCENGPREPVIFPTIIGEANENNQNINTFRWNSNVALAGLAAVECSGYVRGPLRVWSLCYTVPLVHTCHKCILKFRWL